MIAQENVYFFDGNYQTKSSKLTDENSTSSLISSGNVSKSPYLEQRKPLNQRNFYIKS